MAFNSAHMGDITTGEFNLNKPAAVEGNVRCSVFKGSVCACSGCGIHTNVFFLIKDRITQPNTVARSGCFR